MLEVHWLPQISYIKNLHIQELTQQYVPGCDRACKEFTSIVSPTKFINGGEEGLPGYPICQTSSTKTSSTFVERISQLPQLWNEEGLSSFDQAFLMCEMVDQYTSRSTRVICVEAIKTIWQRKLQERLCGPIIRSLSGWKIAKENRASSKKINKFKVRW